MTKEDIKVDFIYRITEDADKTGDINMDIDEIALVTSIFNDGGDMWAKAKTVYFCNDFNIKDLDDDRTNWTYSLASWIEDYTIVELGPKENYPEYFL